LFGSSARVTNSPGDSKKVIPVSFPRQQKKNFFLGQEEGFIETRVARFFLLQHAKTGENVPNGRKIYQIP
jgi:hypothetical protein